VSLWLVITVLPQLESRDVAAMHLVGTVEYSHRPRRRGEIGERKHVADAGGTKELDGPVEHARGHFRDGYLDLRDGLLSRFVADRVHHPCRVEDEQPRAIDLDARLRDAFLRDIVVAERLAESDALARAPAHQLQRTFGDANLPHAVVDAAGTETRLRNFEATPLAQEKIRRRDAHILEDHLAMPVWRIVVSEHVQHPDHLHAWSVARDKDHRLLLVAIRVAGIGFPHDDQHPAARIADTGCPPLAAVDDVLVTVPHDRRLDVGRVRRRDVRLGHRECRSNSCVEQRREPVLLLLGRSKADQHFHIARIRKGAVEDFRCDG
jgi:hypothetical protein